MEFFGKSPYITIENTMLSFLKEYPYLTGNLFGLILYVVIFIAFKSQRKHLLIASLFAVPQSLMSLIMIPYYWHPKRVYVLGIGPEDILFCFLSGGIAWSEAIWFVRKRLVFRFEARTILRRYLLHFHVSRIGLHHRRCSWIEEYDRPVSRYGNLGVFQVVHGQENDTDGCVRRHHFDIRVFRYFSNNHNHLPRFPIPVE